MVNANLGPEHYLGMKLTEFQGRLANLETSPVLQNASATQSDGTTGAAFYMGDSGSTEFVFFYGPGTPGVSPVNGQWPVAFSIGQLTSGGSPAGTGLVGQRPDGSESITIGNAGVGLIDHNNALYLSESETAFGGIKTPYMSMGQFANTNLSTWPATSSGSFTTIATCIIQAWQPSVFWWAQGYAPTGVTGNFRMLCNGTQIGTTWTATNNAFTSSSQGAALAAGVTLGGAVQLDLQAQVTAGAGTVSCQVYGVEGYASS